MHVRYTTKEPPLSCPSNSRYGGVAWPEEPGRSRGLGVFWPSVSPAPIALAPRPHSPTAGRTIRSLREGSKRRAPRALSPGPTPQVRAERATGLAVSPVPGGNERQRGRCEDEATKPAGDSVVSQVSNMFPWVTSP